MRPVAPAPRPTGADGTARLHVTTPEGVPLALQIAPAGDRAGAFLLDALLVGAMLVAVRLLGSLAEGTGSGWGQAFASIAAFAMVNGYFVFFEARGGGATPGKRWTGIRVVDAQGGALTTEAVLARNLVRDVETFLPLAALAAPEALWGGAPGWARLLAGGWLVLFAFLPLFNRERVRVGDLVAGTRVVLAPRAVLLADPGAANRVAEGAAHVFTEAQLDAYGNYELQVLEDVLRRANTPAGRDALRVVHRQVQKKIGAPDGSEPEAFLRAFYAALRARLERRLLLGKAKADKFSK